MENKFQKRIQSFSHLSLGSALETQYLFILSKDLNYLEEPKFQDFENKINTIKSKIYKLKEKLTQ